MTKAEIKENIKNLEIYETLNLCKGLIYTTAGITIISLTNPDLSTDISMSGLTLSVAGIAVASSSIETERKIENLEKKIKPKRLTRKK